MFAAGRIGMRHVEVIVRELDTPAARRLTPQRWAGAEERLAEWAALYTPGELADLARQLIDTLDEDGPGEDEHPPDPGNELRLSPRRDGSGGRIAGDLDAVLFATVATAVDALATPSTAEDTRPLPERQAHALAEVCRFTLDHDDDGPLPERGGERPHLNVLVRLDDLQHRARAAVLDFGGAITPEQLRLLCCEARVVPIVMGGKGRPLDIGRATRVIPDGLRRAVAARDRGCAHPGCGRTASWCDIHHVLPWEDGGATALDNLVMLCRFHHRSMHRPGWIVRIRAPDSRGTTRSPGHTPSAVAHEGTTRRCAARKVDQRHRAHRPSLCDAGPASYPFRRSASRAMLLPSAIRFDAGRFLTGRDQGPVRRVFHVKHVRVMPGRRCPVWISPCSRTT